MRMRGRGVWCGPGSMVYVGQVWMWLGQLGSFGWYVPRWVLVIWVDRMGDEAEVSGGGRAA